MYSAWHVGTGESYPVDEGQNWGKSHLSWKWDVPIKSCKRKVPNDPCMRCVCVCVNGSCCGPGPGGPRGWPRQADFSHVVPSHKLPAFTSITFTGTSRVVANTGQGQGGNTQGKFWRSASCEALRLFLLSRIDIWNKSNFFAKWKTLSQWFIL